MRSLLGLCLFTVVGLLVPGLSAQDVDSLPALVDDEGLTLPLPRWREGGTPYDPEQSLYPHTVEAPRPKDMPTSGLIASPPEYAPTRGVLFLWKTGHWTDVVRDCVVALTADPTHDEIAYVVVRLAEQGSATSILTAAGADMSKVVFINKPSDSVWLRDYGPHFIWQSGALDIVDSHYYPTRPRDNFTPTKLGDDNLLMPTYDMGLYYSGGNFQPGPDRSAFVTSLMRLDNPPSEGFDDMIIGELFNRYQGVDALHIMPQLPFSVDGTGHIDMWLYLVDEDTVIISAFKPGSNQTAIDITNNAVPYMQNLGFTVYRTPAWHGGGVHWTYTNAYRVNDRIFIPTYAGYPTDSARALAAWQAAAGPDVEIVPIECSTIIPAAGAVHCIVMQVPHYADPEPAVHVVWPDGGELLASGTTRTIQWVATDTDNATIPQIDLYYTIDDGDTWEHIDTTTDTGFYDWLIPDVDTTEARIRVVATSADTDQGEAASLGTFQIAAIEQSVYDFSTGAGVDRFGWGYQTTAWSDVDGVRAPVSDELPTLLPEAYARVAASDATGNDADPNRYIAPVPDVARESTHTYELTIAEDPAEIDEIELLWEGYADNCTQIELYVWDYVDGQWCDGNSSYGQNAYMDNFAGNRDSDLTGTITADFERYIDLSGQMTLMLYAERERDESFHDYLSVTVKILELEPIVGDLDGDGDVDLSDLAILLAAYGNCAGDPDYNPVADLDGDDCVGLSDLAMLLANYGVGT